MQQADQVIVAAGAVTVSGIDEGVDQRRRERVLPEPNVRTGRVRLPAHRSKDRHPGGHLPDGVEAQAGDRIVHRGDPAALDTVPA